MSIRCSRLNLVPFLQLEYCPIFFPASLIRMPVGLLSATVVLSTDPYGVCADVDTDGPLLYLISGQLAPCSVLSSYVTTPYNSYNSSFKSRPRDRSGAPLCMPFKSPIDIGLLSPPAIIEIRSMCSRSDLLFIDFHIIQARVTGSSLSTQYG